MVAIEIKAR